MSKKSKEPQKPSTAWQGTYGDMITLMLCFFVMLYDPSEVDTTTLSQIQASLAIQDESMENPTPTGGMSLTAGRLADLGNTVNSLPSIEKQFPSLRLKFTLQKLRFPPMRGGL